MHSVATLLLWHCCSKRSFSLSAAHCARASISSHYDVLGITAKATQADVKSAYYKLSMVYHPDRCANSAESVEKFRTITAAYEVLSNYRLRRLYDKGSDATSITMVEFAQRFEISSFQESAAASPA